MNAPAELAIGGSTSLREAGMWAGAAALMLAAHMAFAYALRDLAPLQPEAAEQALVIDLAPLPISTPDSVESEAIPAEEPAESLQPVEEQTETSDVKPEEMAAIQPETVDPAQPEELTQAEPEETAPVESESVEQPQPEETPQADAEAVKPEPLQPEPLEQVEPQPKEVKPLEPEPEIVEPQIVENVTPDVVLPLPEPRPVIAQEEEAAPARKKPVKKPVERRPSTEKPKRDKPVAQGATKNTAKPKPSAASQKSKSSTAPKVNVDRWRSQATAAVRRRVSRVRGDNRSLMVNLAINETGAVVSAAILRSSGDARLDSAVLNAVRSVRLPAPPPGTRAVKVPISFN